MIKYRRYGAEATITTMKLDPYFVKLFNKRWYALVKFPEPTSCLFTLAFDRILSFEVTDEKFKYDNNFDPAGWFRECYGIFRDPDIPLEKVVIRAFGIEVNYLRDLPLHHSQKEITTTEEYSDFEMTLRPSVDFFSALLSRGATIKILEPETLADEIRTLHQKAVELYNK